MPSSRKKVRMLNFERILDYLKYSGLTVTIVLNPFHWSWIPKMSPILDTITDGEMDGTMFSFLFIRISCWVDNGDW